MSETPTADDLVPYEPALWIDVPDRENVPPGAIVEDAQNFNRIEGGVTRAHRVARLAWALAAALEDAVAALPTGADVAAAVAGLASDADVAAAVAGLASDADLAAAVAGLASDADVTAAVSGLVDTAQATALAEAAAQAAVSTVIDGAPEAANTLRELKALLDANASGDASTAAALAALVTVVAGKAAPADIATAIAGLAAVARTGAYADLTGKPTIPAAPDLTPYVTKTAADAAYAQTATLELTYPQRVPAAVGKLFAGLAARLTAPCRIAFLGSSTPAGTGATTINDRWTSRFITNLQGLYPSGLSTETAVIYSTTADFGTLSTAAGVHGYNAAEGGLNSGEYLTSTEANKIGALNPRAVLHQVGSNDMGDGITPAQYKTNVLTAIAAIKAATSGPCVHVLIHGHERYDKTTTYPWTAYQAVLFEIAAADPDNVVALDLTRTFSRVGVPSTDPLVLMNADKIHLTDAGHSLTADLVRRGLGLVAATPVPVVATSGATVTAARLTSETATGSTTEINTRSSDVGLGGAARAWVAEPASAQVAVSGGSIVRGGGTLATFFAGWANTATDLEFGFTIGAAPTGGTLFVDVHRVATSGTPDAYRLQVTAAGGLQLSKRVGGGTTALGAASSFTAGDRIVIRRIGTTLAFRRNGTTIVSLTDTSISAAGFCGFAGAASLTAMNIKNVTLDALTL